MFRRRLVLYAVSAQLLICCWIALKLFLLPYVIWKYFGTSAYAGKIGDLSGIVLGTLASLSMGVIGYRHAAYFSTNGSIRRLSLLSMMFIHIPLFLYIGYKYFYTPAWDTTWTLLMSGWLSIVTHPMILVGFYGKWIDVMGAIIFCGCYLLGIWMYFEEHPRPKIYRERAM